MQAELCQQNSCSKAEIILMKEMLHFWCFVHEMDTDIVETNVLVLIVSSDLLAAEYDSEICLKHDSTPFSDSILWYGAMASEGERCETSSVRFNPDFTGPSLTCTYLIFHLHVVALAF